MKLLAIDYLAYQKLLARNRAVRLFWQFWSNYAFVFFAFAALVLIADGLTRPYFFKITTLGVFAFLVGRGLIVTILNILIDRERPYQKFDFIPITSNFFSFRTSYHNSFPSRHTIVYFSVATVVCLFAPRLGAGLIVVSLLAGAGRVILGYHWVTDIIGGAIIGTIIGYLTVLIGYPLLFT